MKKEYLVVAFLAVAIAISGCIQSPVCGNGNCETGESQQNCPQDCLLTQTHFECRNQQCAQVQGTGTNQCATDADCQVPETHTECVAGQCVEVEGVGQDECVTDANCQQCGSPEEQLVRDKMIWDLPELCGFAYGGTWQPNAIDLRYMSPADNDQHSEYFLRIFNSPEEANDSFDDIVNTAPNLWTVSMKEINGNKIYEGISEIPIGEQRYLFWVSGNNVLQGWNGNDIGSIIDDTLFNTLTKAYLEKYPSNIS